MYISYCPHPGPSRQTRRRNWSSWRRCPHLWHSRMAIRTWLERGTTHSCFSPAAMFVGSTPVTHKVDISGTLSLVWFVSTEFNRKMNTCYWAVQILSEPPAIQNSSPNRILGTPIFGAQKRLFRVNPTFFRLEVSPRHIMASWNLQGTLTNSIMLFHNVAPKLVHWLPQDQQNWLAEQFLSISATPL